MVAPWRVPPGLALSHAQLLLFAVQLFEYILEYLRTVRFGEPDHSLALPAEQTELSQIVREVSKPANSMLTVTQAF